MADRNSRTLILWLAAAVLALIAGFRLSSSTGGHALSRSSAVQHPQRAGPVAPVSGVDQPLSPPEDADANRLASKPDVQMEALRARLSQPGVVPGEALLGFRSKEAMNR